MKNLLLLISVVLVLIISFSISNAYAPEACTDGANEELSYEGNWDMHVGGCWSGTPITCAHCEYM